MEEAARLLWEGDCGFLPVVDGQERLVGIVTDRDVCMGSYTRGKRLGELRVESSMTREPSAVHPGDSIELALSTLADRQVRRLPVVDADGRLVGVLSLNDLARAAVRIPGANDRHRMMVALLEALASICEPRVGGRDELARPASPEPVRRRTLSKV